MNLKINGEENKLPYQGLGNSHRAGGKKIYSKVIPEKYKDYVGWFAIKEGKIYE